MVGSEVRKSFKMIELYTVFHSNSFNMNSYFQDIYLSAHSPLSAYCPFFDYIICRQYYTVVTWLHYIIAAMITVSSLIY